MDFVLLGLVILMLIVTRFILGDIEEEELRKIEKEKNQQEK